MLTTTDILEKLIKQKGYKNFSDFAKKAGISTLKIHTCVTKNSWTKEMLKQIGDFLGEDLTKFANIRVGGWQNTLKYYEEHKI